MQSCAVWRTICAPMRGGGQYELCLGSDARSVTGEYAAAVDGRDGRCSFFHRRNGRWTRACTGGQGIRIFLCCRRTCAWGCSTHGASRRRPHGRRRVLFADESARRQSCGQYVPADKSARWGTRGRYVPAHKPSRRRTHGERTAVVREGRRPHGWRTLCGCGTRSRARAGAEEVISGASLCLCACLGGAASLSDAVSDGGVCTGGRGVPCTSAVRDAGACKCSRGQHSPHLSS